MTTNDKLVIRATFADWKTVKTRKQLQLIFEIPIEETEDILTVLGAPMPHRETWCAIARLKPESNAKE